MKRRLGLLMAVAFMAPCSRELSEEEKERELRKRQELRLAGGIVEWEGLAIRDELHGVPIRIQSSVAKENEADSAHPELQVRLGLGFFGGVELTSSSSSFDWGSGELFATFSGKEGQGRLDLELTVTDGEIVAGILTSVQEGAFTLSSVELAKTEQQATSFQFETKEGAIGLIQIEASSDRVESPSDASVPYFAALESSMRFAYFGSVSHRASRVWYDPLKGTIDIWTQADGRVQIREVFANLESLETRVGLVADLPPLPASMFRGAELVASVDIKGSAESTRLLEQLPVLPPLNYTGTFHGEASSYRVVAQLEDTNRVVSTPGSYFLAQFPELRLKGIVCLGKEPYAYFTADTIRLDYLKSELTFRSGSTGVVFKAIWGKAANDYLSITMQPERSNRSLGPATLRLKATREANSCAE